MDRFLANHTSRVDRSESRPRGSKTQARNRFIYNYFCYMGNNQWLGLLKVEQFAAISPLSEISKLEMFGISAIHPSRI